MPLNADTERQRSTARVAGYFGAVTLIVGFSDPTGLLWLPVQFTLKDDLHFSPQQLASFEAIVLAPASLAFVWGGIRDLWTPTWLGDRAYLLGGCLVALALYLALASWMGESTYLPLLVGLLLGSAAFEMMSAASEAMMTTVSRRYQMTGRISAVDHFAQLVAEVSALIVGGWLASRVALSKVFLIASASATAILPLALWCPRAVSRALLDDGSKGARSATRLDDVLKQRGMWLAVALNALWSFSPSWGTPVLFYLTSTIGMSSEAFGVYRAVNYASMAGAALVYSVLCRRQPLGRILAWTLPVNLFGAALILLMTGTLQADVIGAVAGLLIGFGNIALFDLARRSCPPHLVGTGTMLAFSGWTLSSTVGDVCGSWLYEEVGLTACIAVDVLTKGLMLPLLSQLPRGVRDHTDGDDD